MLRYCALILFLIPCVVMAQNICVPILNFSASQNNVCVGNTVTFHGVITNDGTNGIFKWKRNGLDVGDKTAFYTASDFHDSDVITCTYTCRTQCGKDTTVGTPGFLLFVRDDAETVVSIGNNDPLICEGNLTVFTAESSYGSEAIPKYQWYVNDEPVGINGTTYTTDTLTNGAEVKCILTTTVPGCPGSKSSTSILTIYVYPLIHPAIKITPSRTDICKGEQVTFTAIANGGPYPTFAWEINGVPTGDTSASLITSTLNDGDTITCTITVDQDSRCHTSTSAGSNKVGMHVKDFVHPLVSITSGDLDVCAGIGINFEATGQNMGNYKYFQWMVNDKFEGNNATAFTYNQFANTDKVTCVLTTDIPGCSHRESVTSNIKTVTIRPAPVITFTPPDITISSGETAQLNATVDASTTSVMWKPEHAVTSPQSLITTSIPLIHDTLFNLTVTDANGCTSNKDLFVKVLHKLYVPSAFTPNGDGKNDVFRIPPDASLTLQEFVVFDRWGNAVFKTTDAANGWNGTYKGQLLGPGIYVYIIKGSVEGQPLVVKGTVTLLR